MTGDELDTIPPSGEPQTTVPDEELEALNRRRPGPTGIVGGNACEAGCGDAESAELGGE